MADLSEQVLPSVWSLIRHSLLEAPGMSRSELIDHLTPRGLITRQEGGSTTDESRHVRPSLNALIDLGVVTDDGQDSLTLASGSESEQAFRREVTSRYFEVGSESDEEIWGLRSELQHEHHAELALAWLHLQGVTAPIGGFAAAEPLLQRQLGSARTLLRDGVPFNVLERLGRWCGVAAPVDGRDGGGAVAAIIPDPTEAIRSELDQLIEPGAPTCLRERSLIRRRRSSWPPNGSRAPSLRRMSDRASDRAPTEGNQVPRGSRPPPSSNSITRASCNCRQAMTCPTVSASHPAASLARRAPRWLLSRASGERTLPVVSQHREGLAGLRARTVSSSRTLPLRATKCCWPCISRLAFSRCACRFLVVERRRRAEPRGHAGDAARAIDGCSAT